MKCNLRLNNWTEFEIAFVYGFNKFEGEIWEHEYFDKSDNNFKKEYYDNFGKTIVATFQWLNHELVIEFLKESE